MKLKPLKFNSHSVNYLLLALIVLLLIGSLIGAHSIVGLLKKQSNQLVTLKATNQALATEQTNLLVAKKEVAKYSTLEQIAETIVPQDKDQAETVREIVNIATANNITLSAITFPSSTLGQSAGSAATQSLSLSQLTPVKNIPGVYVLPINVQDNVSQDATSYTNFYNFLSSLEQNRRTSQVTNLSIQPVGTSVTFALTIDEYIKPQ